MIIDQQQFHRSSSASTGIRTSTCVPWSGCEVNENVHPMLEPFHALIANQKPWSARTYRCGIKAHPIIDNRNLYLCSGIGENDPGCFRTGMFTDVGEGFLDDAHELYLGCGWETVRLNLRGNI